MKIYGIGADIVKVKRFKKLINNKLFLKKIFSNYEITRCKKIKNSFNCFAKRFAAKEAFSKALGTGISTGIIFNEIVVLNESSGKPFIKLMNNTKKIVDKRLKKKKYKISLSLSDEDSYAVAFVTISI
tara:strand:+ start:158 stop:541 length:384 start_codon:yes stop_codon:yes gene_type:complete